MKKIVILMILGLSCGPKQNQESELNYEILPHYSKAFLGLYSTTKICIRGPLKDHWSSKVYTALQKWQQPLKKFDEDIRTAYSLSCDSPDYEIRTHASTGRAHATYNGTIDLYQNSTLSTLIHELGHVFAGLADTYIEGVWSCKPGQPVSIMCTPRAGTTLRDDDLLGLQESFRRNASLNRPKYIFQKIIERMSRQHKCPALRGLLSNVSASLTFDGNFADKAHLYIVSDFGNLLLTSHYLSSARFLYSDFSRKVWDYLGNECPTGH